ncbi:MAG: cobyric acid synthase CobQ [Candidatus Infernicultor aquiphilus]|uniref:Cobyric acid synthase n=1 Tax=Candidatus Infernicultor aquiphilus TaxID=1805029 RepID=A0A1J5GI91_9BACT|nr:cobyric acid synthase [bacterium]OIP72525.1 MAG: cobyric acid synthase CobQ [Candidatus Atribacteria bacterium CG2_30_33_13]PIU24830.1 MAG: cobyric acid synthase CobQ [Candidatus Atribacteria bacterium CG08_land_8_20_14_0_20_33_29]PIW11187.1 MAG: cobyric acid synthase CobQ [Candidatus Atribacteria bacterium CG17_big_fil_post_rev_8_21_14_2_50_34_11]PIX33632.1 MAG: cobyric acid synthase CobQ [Candidatus Atribacteria bacterium CG_4_8_14_3_um_filter_34_18]PIY33968.1 MAG: cobyric acid synthase C
MMVKAIMIQGTGSSVGKSIIVTALCRIFYQDGFRVAPFKAQNMALNSFITKDGKEMGRAQVVQAEACGIEATVDMNPILMKPTSEVGSQIIVCGKPIGNMQAQEYRNYKSKLISVVKDSFLKLAHHYELIVIEGAGSPAEINLKEDDIVNMRMAQIADCPVLLVADIDKGGAFAWVVGTLELLTIKERNRIRGIIINKFRGDKEILQPGLNYLERKTKKPVLGIIPYFRDIQIEEEDSVNSEKNRYYTQPELGKINIEVLYLPHISNFTDFDPLEREEGISLRYVKIGERSSAPDLLIIPGSKNTLDDLYYLKKSGYQKEISNRLKKGTVIVGICGGWQMLGRELYDPEHTESSREKIGGLGLINGVTTLKSKKITFQVRAHLLPNPFFNIQDELVGYEIHTGETILSGDEKPLFKITQRGSIQTDINDGVVSKKGMVWGTYIHGIFDNSSFRRSFINFLKSKKGLMISNGVNQDRISYQEQKDREYDRLACLIRDNLDMDKIYHILGTEKR